VDRPNMIKTLLIKRTW